MRVVADREICMAAGLCVMTADAFFDQDADGIVLLASDEVPAGPHTDLARRVQNAVKLCPSGALRLLDSTSNIHQS
ncbi:ferredoxin [Mycobacterium riyadhense]|uniref:ferredoxin n=1 Tax=Mycobacterium riyadhense TaxID=486698 RepID=UPI0019514FDC|nr:(4Fe-4S)-binding protein [Mycobacterium riyadhense]